MRTVGGAVQGPRLRATIAAVVHIGMTRALAVYDLDGTILDGDSHAILLAELVLAPARRRGRARRHRARGRRLALGLVDDDHTKATAARALAGMTAAQIRAWAEPHLARAVLPRVRPAMAARVERDREAGFATLLLSASLDDVVAAVARSLRFDHAAGTRLAYDGGRATGRIDGEALRGEEKAHYLARFARSHGVDLSRSRAYGDRVSDAPLLSLVGEPFAVHPDRGLRRIARLRGWPVLT